MTKIRLCALDVDGTLVGGDLTISENVRAAVESLRSAGIAAAIVTGRSERELDALREQFPWIRYFIVSNGARAFDALSGRPLYERLLPLSIARSIADEALALPTMVEVYADGASYVDAAAWADKAAFRVSFLDHPSLGPARIPIPDVRRFLAERKSDVEKLYVSFRRPSDLPALHAFCESFPVDLVVSIHDGLEVNRRGVEKGAALAELCARLKIAPDETAAVGDGLADVSMLRFAGFSVAMGNACAEVRAAAGLVAPDNDRDGAAWAIERVLLAR